MQQQNFNSAIVANTTAQDAFNKISQVNAWWAADFTGRAEKLNDVFTVRFGTTYVTFTIAEAAPPNKIVWLVTDCYLPFVQDKTEWNATSVVWEISTENGLTKINMTHVGLVPEVECYENCKAGWTRFVQGSLLQFITSQQGMPQGSKAA
jgi:hypothetical protein